MNARLGKRNEWCGNINLITCNCSVITNYFHIETSI